MPCPLWACKCLSGCSTGHALALKACGISGHGPDACTPPGAPPARRRIPDPDAVKPEDWDEDAPKEIPDEDAVKPEGWLDEEPLEIEDPGASFPRVAVWLVIQVVIA